MDRLERRRWKTGRRHVRFGEAPSMALAWRIMSLLALAALLLQFFAGALHVVCTRSAPAPEPYSRPWRGDFPAGSSHPSFPSPFHGR